MNQVASVKPFVIFEGTMLSNETKGFTWGEGFLQPSHDPWDSADIKVL